MKRRICFILAVAMLLSSVALFSSCNNGNADDSASTTVTTLPGGNNSGGNNEDDEAKLYEDLPTGDYEGFDFKTLTRQLHYESISTFVPEDGSQNTVDAALFARNSYVKETLNINIVDNYTTATGSIVNAISSAGDYEYDVIFDRADGMGSYAKAGAILGVDEYADKLNFNKPWWAKEAMDDISIDGKVFQLFGDINVGYYEATYVIGFNKDHLIDNKQAMPYDIVRAGKWTIGEFEKLIKNIADGSKYYGITGHAMASSVFMVGSGIEIVEQDEDEILRIYDNEDHLVNVYTRIKNLFFASNGFGKTNYIDPPGASQLGSHFWTDSPENGNFNERFTKGLCTFFMITAGEFVAQARASDFEYGYLPIPKYDTEQEKYIGLLHGGSIALGVFSTNPDLERTSVILENFGAYSHKMVRYEYYDVLLKGRAVRDPDSMEMLDICFGVDERGKTTFSLDKIYGFGLSAVIELNMFDNVDGIMDKLDEASGAAEGGMEDLIEAFK